MSVSNPETLSEWMEYVSILQEDQLISKATAANSKRFFDKLLQEGFTMDDINAIMKAFARRFRDINLQPPRGLLDLSDLSVSDVVLPDPETVEWEPEPDEIDRDVAALDLETEWDDTMPLPSTEQV